MSVMKSSTNGSTTKLWLGRWFFFHFGLDIASPFEKRKSCMHFLIQTLDIILNLISAYLHFSLLDCTEIQYTYSLCFVCWQYAPIVDQIVQCRCGGGLKNRGGIPSEDFYLVERLGHLCLHTGLPVCDLCSAAAEYHSEGDKQETSK